MQSVPEDMIPLHACASDNIWETYLSLSGSPGRGLRVGIAGSFSVQLCWHTPKGNSYITYHAEAGASANLGNTVLAVSDSAGNVLRISPSEVPGRLQQCESWKLA